MVFLEAQSCGIPVIAFRNGGIPEVVRDGETGVLVPMYDLDRFAGAIEKLLTDTGLRRQMGKLPGLMYAKTINWIPIMEKLRKFSKPSSGIMDTIKSP